MEAVNDIDQPAATIISKNKRDRVKIFTGKVDTQNRPVIMIVSYSDKGNFNNVEIYTNFANSAYGRKRVSGENDLDFAINNGDVLQYDNKKNQQLPLTSSGYNTLSTLGSVDFNRNIAKFMNGVKGLFPTQEEILKANATVKQQTMERLKKSCPIQIR